MKKSLSIFVIIGLGILVYSNTFFSSFHFDDDAYIVHNFAIRNIHNLVDIWNFCPCRFITFLSIAVNYHFHQLSVFGYHLFNLAVHLGCALLVWWLFLLTFSTPVMKKEKISQHANILALFAALVFVTHPVQIEAVTYIWQRAASMAAFFYLASLCFYVRSRLLEGAGQNKPAIFYYALSLIAAIAAMFTKENAVTLPLMIFLYEACFLKVKKDFNWGQLYPFWVTMFIIPQTMVLTKTTRVQEIHSIVGGPEGITPIHYLLTQFRVMITYIRLLFLPFNLNLDYDYPVFKNILQIPVITSFLSLTAILYFAKLMYSKYRLISFSIFWFFLTLLPESSILPQEDVIFEHRLYLPMVGYCLFLVSGAYYLFYRHSERSEESKGFLRSFAPLRMTVVLLSLITAFYSVLTYQRNTIWKNELVLWNDAVKKSPHKARPYINRGWAFYNQGNYDQAMSDYNKAIGITTESIYPFDDKGLIYAKQGKFTQAISEYNKAIKINPYYAIVYFHRGLAYYMLNNYSQALSDYNKAIEINHEYVDAYNQRAKLYAQQNNLTKAVSDYKTSIKIDPGQTDIQTKIFNLLKEEEL